MWAAIGENSLVDDQKRDHNGKKMERGMENKGTVELQCSESLFLNHYITFHF